MKAQVNIMVKIVKLRQNQWINISRLSMFREESRILAAYKMELELFKSNTKSFQLLTLVTKSSILNATGVPRPRMPGPRRVEQNTYMESNHSHE